MSFVRYNTDDQVVSSETVVRGLWSGDVYSLENAFFTSSNNTAYYLNVYNTAATESLQFAIQYGTLNGSGSSPLNPLVVGITPTRITYGEYRNLVYGTENNNFVFNGSTVSNGIYAVNIARSRYKESLQPGSLELKLSGITLIDDSTTTNLSRFIGENRYYNIVSGSITNGVHSTATNYGFFFPDMGLLILDSGSLTSNITGTGSAALFNSIKTGNSFKLQSSETVSSTYFFTRVKNSEFNYTTNPSIIDDNGNLLYTTLINNPQTFPTSVGLYNDNNELLAVAKLSRPLTKDFTKEALIRIKLDY